MNYGHWTVLGAASSQPKSQVRRVTVRCVCGDVHLRQLRHLRSGASTSCGCQRSARLTKHGQSTRMRRTVEHDAWVSMKQRCENPNNPRWKDYGGRGIRVCLRWRQSFTAFLADMGLRPTSRHSIDRYPDNDGNYDPGNCRWATSREQADNRRRRA